jgi:microcin C transport system substrate-binding protein
VSADRLSTTFRLNSRPVFILAARCSLPIVYCIPFTQLTSKLAAPRYRAIYAEVKGGGGAV